MINLLLTTSVEEDISDVKKNSDLLFFSYSATMGLANFFIMLSLDGRPIILTSIVLFFIMSTAAMYFRKNNPNFTFIAVFTLNTSILLLGRFLVSNESGSSPILTYVEASYIITLLFRYGKRIGVMYGALFVVLAFSRLYFADSALFSLVKTYEINQTHMFIVGCLVSSYIVCLTVFYSTRINRLGGNLVESKKTLDSQYQQLSLKQERINKQLFELNELSNANSHVLRAPVCRLKGLIDLKHTMDLDSEAKDHHLEQLINDEQERCITEIEQTLNLLEKQLNYN